MRISLKEVDQSTNVALHIDPTVPADDLQNPESAPVVEEQPALRTETPGEENDTVSAVYSSSNGHVSPVISRVDPVGPQHTATTQSPLLSPGEDSDGESTFHGIEGDIQITPTTETPITETLLDRSGDQEIREEHEPLNPLQIDENAPLRLQTEQQQTEAPPETTDVHDGQAVGEVHV